MSKYELKIETNLDGLPLEGPLFSTSQWLKPLVEQSPYSLEVWLVYKGEELCAWLPLQKRKVFGFTHIFEPITFQDSGPFFLDGKKFYGQSFNQEREICTFLFNKLTKHAQWAQFYPPLISAYAIKESKLWCFKPAYRSIINLNDYSIDRLPKNVRGKIKKAQKSNLVIRIDDTTVNFSNAYERTFNAKGISSSLDGDTMLQIKSVLEKNDALSTLVAFDSNDTPVAFLSLAFDTNSKKIIVWHSCSTIEGNRMAASSLLIHEAASRYCNSHSSINLGGIDDPSLANFKVQFSSSFELKGSVEYQSLLFKTLSKIKARLKL